MNVSPRGPSPSRPAVTAGLLVLWLLPAAFGAETREPVGNSLAAKGMLVRRENPKADWQLVDKNEAIYSGDLLLGLSGAAVRSKDGAVELTLRTDFDSPLPLLEPAAILHPPGEFDLDFTLDRGRVDVTNRKESGPARVRLHAWGETWEATLQEPGASLAVELVGRWRPGTPFTLNPAPKDVPSADMLFLALVGEVDLKHEAIHQLLKAPPGPALIGWNNHVGMDRSRQRLDKLPAWASESPQTEGEERWKKHQEMRAYLIKALNSHTPGEVMDDLLTSDDAFHRHVGAILAGAFDDIPRLGKVLHETKHIDLWDEAVVVLRHWLGRAPGQDQKLYNGLVEQRGMTPVQAQTIIEFLHGFGENDLARPETYEMLIDYLADDRLAIRGLAFWHLRRLVPAGAKIPYDPLAAKAEREKARQEWKKLVPPGKLPPRDQEKKEP